MALNVKSPGGHNRLHASYKCPKRDGTFVLSEIRRFIYRRGKSILAQIRNKPISVYGIQYDIFHSSVPQPYRDLILYERYEFNEVKLVQKYMNPTTPVIELGAGLGVVSCVISLIAYGTDHIAVEANTALIDNLQHQRDINELHFDIINMAYHPTYDCVEFDNSDQFSERSVIQSENNSTQTIDAVNLETLSNSFKQPRFNLVCDIEGLEWIMIQEEGNLLSDKAMNVVLETHPDKVPVIELVDRMDTLGFKKADEKGNVYAFANKKTA